MKPYSPLVPQTLLHRAEISKVCFMTLRPEEIKQLSVMEVTEFKIYQGSIPMKGGNSLLT